MALPAVNWAVGHLTDVGCICYSLNGYKRRKGVSSNVMDFNPFDAHEETNGQHSSGHKENKCQQ